MSGERAKAAEVVRALSPEQAYVDEFVYDGDVAPLIDAIAAALAAARADERQRWVSAVEGPEGDRIADEIAAQYRDPTLARFAINDYRDRLRGLTTSSEEQ